MAAPRDPTGERVVPQGAVTLGLTLSGTVAAKHASIPIAAPMRQQDGVAF
jgi:hypothetical protein